MPVAIAIGVDPTVVLASISKFPYGTDEFSVAGGLRGEPVPLVRCETVDLEVPANAEIVLEGFVRAGYREQEGPFGEFSGYMSPGGQQPVIDVTCITRRRTPVYHSFLSQMPPSESSCIRSLSRSAGLFHHLSKCSDCRCDVHFTESGGASGMLVISMKKEYPEQVKEVAWGAWSLMNKECKFTVVVDDDIDVRNPFQVEWAMSFRAQPARDRFIVERRRAFRRRSVDGAARTFRSMIRAGAPAAKCSSTPRASIPTRPPRGCRRNSSNRAKEMVGVWFCK